MLWAAGVVVMAAFLIRRALAMRRLVAQARPANGFMCDVLKYCCKCMGVKRTVRLKLSVSVDGPVVYGLMRPVIVMPHNLAPTLGSRHLRAVLLHELAHVKRADQWVNLAQTVLQVIYFYNPLLWLANRTIRNLRDQAVDETVLATMGEKVRWYPETLAGLAGFVSEPSAFGAGLIGVVESQSVMSRRITSAPNPPAREPVLSAV
jgi:bla regulator protein BlaR1